MRIVSEPSKQNRTDSWEGTAISWSRKPQSACPSKSLRSSHKIIVSKLVGKGMQVTVFLVDPGYVFRNHRPKKKKGGDLLPVEGAAVPKVSREKKKQKSKSGFVCLQKLFTVIASLEKLQRCPPDL